jgi:ketosteroid isomerase-like protein
MPSRPSQEHATEDSTTDFQDSKRARASDDPSQDPGKKEGTVVSETPATDERVAIPREFVARVFNGKNPEAARDFFTADAAWHGPSIGTVSGVDNIVPLLGAFIGGLSDIRAEEQDVIASNDLVALRLVVNATQTGDLLGISATGRDVRWDAVDIYRVTDDGKISEQWAFEDLAALGSQLGAFSLPWAN